jgi:hypothetical protein
MMILFRKWNLNIVKCSLPSPRALYERFRCVETPGRSHSLMVNDKDRCQPELTNDPNSSDKRTCIGGAYIQYYISSEVTRRRS